MELAVVYWSGTGHTEAMAKAVAEGAGATLYTADEFTPAKAAEVDKVAMGCPAMGSEVLEESEFQPMFDTCKDALKGKKAVLFGSFGWGDGEWMRTWEDDCRAAGIELASESVICQDDPDDDVLNQCRALGEALKNA
ncbi:MAG: flavodoxin domain-containing protein [Clostridia bacterium]|nr:flavodoxin domain-containing protein [Clostridia bacterium]